MRGRRYVGIAISAALGAFAPIVCAAQTSTPIAAASAPAGAGDPAPVTIRINAVVVDARGRAVADLKPSDFTLDDNGVAQTLESVERRAIVPSTEPAAPVRDDGDELRAAKDPSTRLFAIFLDEFHTTPGASSQRVRDALPRFLDTAVRPHDLLYVMKPLGSVRDIRFTRDRAAARAAIDSFEGRRGDYEARTDFEREFFGRAPAAVEIARSQLVATGLRELTLRIGELEPTRAVLVFVSEQFPRMSAGEGRRLPGWPSIARAANHFNLPIYTLDPAEAEPDADMPERDTASPPPATSGSRGAGASRSDLRGGVASGRGAAARPGSGYTLATLASDTGGQFAAGAAAITETLDRLSRELDACYVLTYRPSAPTDGRFHPIVVTTTRKAATVRTPSGYWSPLPSEWRAWLARPTTPVETLPTRAVHRSRAIELWYGFEPVGDGRLRLVLTWQPARALPVTPRPPTPAVVTLKASTVGGETLFDRGVHAIPVAGEANAPINRADFVVPPGRLQLDMTIESADGRVIDTGAQDIDVPAYRGAAPVVLAPQIVRARNARDVQELASRSDLAPTPARTFRRTEQLLLRVPVYNAGPDGTVVARIVNGLSQPIRELEAIGATSAAGVRQFDVPLAFLAPGEYALEIVATTPSGRARQIVRFKLLG